MTKKYTVQFEFIDLFTVEIDPEKAAQPIKEMVRFWSCYKENLEANDGDYTATWLKQLGRFILNRRRPPQDGDEGWYPLNGSHGIQLLSWDEWEPDSDGLTIEAH